MGRDTGGLRAEMIGPGIVELGPVPEGLVREYEAWLEAGHHAGMEYLERHRELRRDPRLLLEGARTMLVYAFPYPTETGRPESLPMISRYAFGEDYHDRVRRELKAEGERICGLLRERGLERTFRVCVDTAPLAERYWAVRSGLCVRGVNGTAIIPGVGSFFFLGEVIFTATGEELESLLRADHNRATQHGGLNPGGVRAMDAIYRVPTGCGECGACLRACPTGALLGDGTVDCRWCLSYLTIEHRGDWDEIGRAAMETRAGRETLYGCDRCLAVCPHNRTSGLRPQHSVDAEGEFGGRDISRPYSGEREERGENITPEGILRGLTAEEAAGLTQEEFSRAFRGMAIKRAKLEGLRRNAINCLPRR